MPKVLELNKTISYSYESKEEFEKHQSTMSGKGWKLQSNLTTESKDNEKIEATYEKDVVNKEDMSPNHKVELKIEELGWLTKGRAIGALEREEEEHQSYKFIRDDIEKHGDRVIDVFKFDNYHFVHYKDNFNGVLRERYRVYIDGKRCIRVTKSPHVALLIALAYQYDGNNTHAVELISRMLGIEEED